MTNQVGRAWTGHPTAVVCCLLFVCLFVSLVGWLVGCLFACLLVCCCWWWCLDSVNIYIYVYIYIYVLISTCVCSLYYRLLPIIFFIYIYTYTVYYYNITCTRPPHAPLKKPGAFHRRGNFSIKAGMTDAAFLSSPGNLLIRPLSSKPSKVLGASQQSTTIHHESWFDVLRNRFNLFVWNVSLSSHLVKRST